MVALNKPTDADANTTQELIKQLDSLVSEGRNPHTMNLDTLSNSDLLTVINQEDQKVALAVEKALPQITQAVDFAYESLKNGGRLIYIGAGTSGRLGVLDAVECRPTFSVPDELVVGLIAGGESALIHSVEGAEDNPLAGKSDLANIALSAKDIVIGIAASGRTPYVIGALEYANQTGCHTVSLVCNPNSPMLDVCDVGICAEVGPECLTGSTRMKSGTAQKLVLNMISTASMVKLGKVYENLMIDVNASNQKLRARAVRIVMQATQCNQELAKTTLDQANNSAKLAILMILTSTNAENAKTLLDNSQGHLRQAITAENSVTDK
ncbi:N-acetylmuramic acid 6-phosphate etherase [Glaciecola petra]|uniref:N-acetylmuramic acid 6-phosphate etherase n=1 Tax=Glaciecola petra TaxID=3075602 RepID=A0ABU2ZSS3_9ALTE|nr:N-acetylmuramic acid 6-phosphate etherase [Aestuariibacter sp. P117]MDT0595359.1 N-acetylmuramic acid 6-phosphate etherase [Aestuariibacter sp. P117]